MADEMSMPDSQEDPSQNNPLWHDEYMNLREFENFDAMQQTYLSLQMANMSLDENSHAYAVNANEMSEMYPQYIQAYNYHYRPEEYRPELIPPVVRVQNTTPPERQSPPRQSQVAAAAHSHPEGLSASWTRRPPEQGQDRRGGSSQSTGTNQSASASQGSASSQNAGAKKKQRRK
ncbi:hypothetical protein ACWD5R_06005 [Streptomyces sp. NPDC002514]|uniref:hypothetical protein n=1 Tax=Streptomyces sp. NPDC001270 TaxID=3364554 RepID=UPI00367AB77F